MASIERTAYPRFPKRLGTAELDAGYRLTEHEIRFVRDSSNGNSQRLTFMAMFKTRQLLGYVPALGEIPGHALYFLADLFDFPRETPLLDPESKMKTLFRFHAAIRSHLASTAYTTEADGEQSGWTRCWV